MQLPKNQDLCLLHNPNCSKSRAAWEWLTNLGVKFSVREYLRDPLSKEELEELAVRLGRPVVEWVRDPVPVEQAKSLAVPEAHAFLMQHLLLFPESLQRPILVSGRRAVIARSVEAMEAWWFERSSEIG